MVNMGLPAELTRLIGRDQQARQVRQAVGDRRLVTLTGPGGGGKTRLALRVAHDGRDRFRDGAWWVELASLDDQELVAQRIAAALGVPLAPDRPAVVSIIDHLGDGDGLLVLDNCEHLAAGCAAVVDRLLRAVGGLRILSTSREPLGVAGETTWPVLPLALPDLERAVAVAELRRCPSVELFTERATAASPRFTLTEHNAAAVAGLCRRLDGIPLAIELAAAWTRVLSPAQILDKLGDDLTLLADPGRPAEARHRTLLATMDWSHDRLTSPQRKLLHALSVFAGTFGLEAVEAVADVPPAEVLQLVSELVDKSLIVVDRGDSAEPVRYRLLETVRRYTAGKLAAAGAAPRVRAAHAAFFGSMASQAESGLMGPDQRDWVIRLRRDHDNIAVALGWLYECGDAIAGLDIAGQLGRYWWFGGHFVEGASWITAFLDRPAARPRTVQRARALHALGLATFWHETPAAGVEASRERFEEAVAIFRELGDTANLATTLRDLGGYWKGRGDADVANAVLQESAALAGQIGDDYAVAAATAYLGVVAAYDGDVDEARAQLDRALPVLRERGGTDEVARCDFFLGCLDCDTGDAAAARARFEQLITLDLIAALPYVAGFGLDGLARLAAAEGQPHRALRLAGAAEATHRRAGTSAGPAYDRYVAGGVDRARQLLDPAAQHRAYERGRAMTLAEAVAEGLRPSPHGAGVEGGVLSAREAEVLRLAADGLADAQIAAALHLSPRTVGNHLSAVYRKLGVTNRTAAVRHVHYGDGSPSTSEGSVTPVT